MPDEQKWKPGDVVKLKSGGPRMTVETYDHTDKYAVNGVRCVWFPSNHFVINVSPLRDCFKEEALEADTEETES